MRVEVYGQLTGLRGEFESALKARCAELAINLDLAAGQNSPAVPDPAVAVVFPSGGSVWTPVQSSHYQHLKEAAYTVLPVVATAPEAKNLPAAISSRNAFQTKIWGNVWPDGLVDEVLSHGWQRRRERRVFLSYKRSDSGPVARQIYDALTERGYVTFLDDISIRKGLNFQPELKWWLNDADAVIVLATPNFTSSQWCMEEINAAKSGGIGLLGVVWPASVFSNPRKRAFPIEPPPSGTPPQPVSASIDVDQQLPLDEADFKGTPSDPLCEQELTDSGLAKVLAHCARQRALAIRLRLENLIPLAERVLKPQGGLQPSGAAGDYTFTDGAGAFFFVRVLPFRPDALAVRETFDTAGAQANVGCFYSECDLNDPRAKAMRWLADGRQGAGAALRTRIWACMGDKEIA